MYSCCSFIISKISKYLMVHALPCVPPRTTIPQRAFARALQTGAPLRPVIELNFGFAYSAWAWRQSCPHQHHKLKGAKSGRDGVANVKFLLEGTRDVKLIARLARCGSAAVEDVGGILKERCGDIRSKLYYGNIDDVRACGTTMR
jgi:hypothetical protein